MMKGQLNQNGSKVATKNSNLSSRTEANDPAQHVSLDLKSSASMAESQGFV